MKFKTFFFNANFRIGQVKYMSGEPMMVSTLQGQGPAGLQPPAEARKNIPPNGCNSVWVQNQWNHIQHSNLYVYVCVCVCVSSKTAVNGWMNRSKVLGKLVLVNYRFQAIQHWGKSQSLLYYQRKQNFHKKDIIFRGLRENVRNKIHIKIY